MSSFLRSLQPRPSRCCSWEPGNTISIYIVQCKCNLYTVNLNISCILYMFVFCPCTFHNTAPSCIMYSAVHGHYTCTLFSLHLHCTVMYIVHCTFCTVNYKIINCTCTLYRTLYTNIMCYAGEKLKNFLFSKSNKTYWAMLYLFQNK